MPFKTSCDAGSGIKLEPSEKRELVGVLLLKEVTGAHHESNCFFRLELRRNKSGSIWAKLHRAKEDGGNRFPRYPSGGVIASADVVRLLSEEAFAPSKALARTTWTRCSDKVRFKTVSVIEEIKPGVMDYVKTAAVASEIGGVSCPR